MYIELLVQKSQLILLFRLIWGSGIHLSGYFDDISNNWHINLNWPPNYILTNYILNYFYPKIWRIPLFRLIWGPGIHLSGYIDDISNQWHINLNWPPNDIITNYISSYLYPKIWRIPLFRLIWGPVMHLSGYLDDISNHWHINLRWWPALI